MTEATEMAQEQPSLNGSLARTAELAISLSDVVDALAKRLSPVLLSETVRANGDVPETEHDELPEVLRNVEVTNDSLRLTNARLGRLLRTIAL